MIAFILYLLPIWSLPMLVQKRCKLSNYGLINNVVYFPSPKLKIDLFISVDRVPFFIIKKMIKDGCMSKYMG